MCICIGMHIHVFMYVCLYVFMHEYMCIYVCICLYVCVYICFYYVYEAIALLFPSLSCHKSSKPNRKPNKILHISLHSYITWLFPLHVFRTSPWEMILNLQGWDHTTLKQKAWELNHLGHCDLAQQVPAACLVSLSSKLPRHSLFLRAVAVAALTWRTVLGQAQVLGRLLGRLPGCWESVSRFCAIFLSVW